MNGWLCVIRKDGIGLCNEWQMGNIYSDLALRDVRWLGGCALGVLCFWFFFLLGL